MAMVHKAGLPTVQHVVVHDGACGLCSGLDVLAGLAESALSEEKRGWDLADPPPLDLTHRAGEGRSPPAPASQPYSQALPQGHDHPHLYDGASHNQPGPGRFPAQPSLQAHAQYSALGQLPEQPPQQLHAQRQHSGQPPAYHKMQGPRTHTQSQRKQPFQAVQSQGQAESPAQHNEAQPPAQLQSSGPAASASDGIIRPQAVRSQGFTMHRGHQLGPAGQLQTLPALPSVAVGAMGPSHPQSTAMGRSHPQASSSWSHAQSSGVGFQPVSQGTQSNPSKTALGSAPGSLPEQSAGSTGPKATLVTSSGSAQQGQAGAGPATSGPQPSAPAPAHLQQQGRSGDMLYLPLGALPKV